MKEKNQLAIYQKCCKQMSTPVRLWSKQKISCLLSSWLPKLVKQAKSNCFMAETEVCWLLTVQLGHLKTTWLQKWATKGALSKCLRSMWRWISRAMNWVWQLTTKITTQTCSRTSNLPSLPCAIKLLAYCIQR